MSFEHLVSIGTVRVVSMLIVVVVGLLDTVVENFFKMLLCLFSFVQLSTIELED